MLIMQHFLFPNSASICVFHVRIWISFYRYKLDGLKNG